MTEGLWDEGGYLLGLKDFAPVSTLLRIRMELNRGFGVDVQGQCLAIPEQEKGREPVKNRPIQRAKTFSEKYGVGLWQGVLANS